jgi:DNA ligase-1
MLAATCKAWGCIRYPMLCSLKLDGIRCIIHNGVPVTRNLKPIPNRFVREALNGLPPLDGELIVGDPAAKDAWNTADSGVMRGNGEPDFSYYVFDLIGQQPFHERTQRLQQIVKDLGNPRIHLLEHLTLSDRDDLEQFEAKAVAAGFEGVMLRSLRGPYKFGRSTENEGYLMKIKRFEDREATVVGFIEQQHNANPAATNALGRTERSRHKGNMIGMNTLGALSCTMDGATFEVGTGFDAAQRLDLWTRRDSLPGQIVTFKCQGLTTDNKPRFPVFKGLRHD